MKKNKSKKLSEIIEDCRRAANNEGLNYDKSARVLMKMGSEFYHLMYSKESNSIVVGNLNSGIFNGIDVEDLKELFNTENVEILSTNNKDKLPDEIIEIMYERKIKDQTGLLKEKPLHKKRGLK